MKHSTRLDERGELPRCAGCGRITSETALTERDPEDGAITFCDADCREVYLTRMDLARDGEGERDLGEAA